MIEYANYLAKPKGGAVRILGIDCGLSKTGWAVVDDGDAIRISTGLIRTNAKGSLSDRLAVLAGGIDEVIGRFKPREAAYEETYVNLNPRSSLALAQARGALLTICGMRGIATHGYAPRNIKKAFTGSGRAEKRQMTAIAERMVGLTRPVDGEIDNGAARDRGIPEDCADALAVAMTHLAGVGTTGSWDLLYRRPGLRQSGPTG